MPATLRYDVAIVGAGPAGLSAALVLARGCRSVFVCDAGTPRSAVSHAMHGFLSRDGLPPAELRRIGRKELARYPDVTVRDVAAVDAKRLAGGRFRLDLADGTRVRARKLLIATGVADELPSLEGLRDFYGTSVFHCPYCDGFELRGQPLAAWGRRRRGVEMARALTAWSPEVWLFSDGTPTPASERRELERNGVRVVDERIARLAGEGAQLEAVVLASGRTVAVRALFFDTPTRPQSLLAQRLGCRLTRKGGIRCGQYEATDVPGVFVAGNLTKDVQLSIVAAAEGARAAFGIHRSLTREEFERRATGRRRIEHPPVDDPDARRRRRPDGG